MKQVERLKVKISTLWGGKSNLTLLSKSILLWQAALIFWLSLNKIDLSTWGYPWLREIQVYSIAIIELMFIFFAKKNMKLIAGITLIAASVIYWAYGLSIDDWVQAFMRNVNLITLIAFVPTLAIPIEVGGYQDAVNAKIRKILNNGRKVYKAYLLAGSTLSVVLNMASVPVLYQCTDTKVRHSYAKELSMAFGRGFSVAAVWSPNIATLALILSYQGLSWVEYVPVGLLIAGLIWLVAFLANPTKDEKTPVSKECESERDATSNRKLLEMIIAAIIFVLILLFFDSRSNIGILIIAPVSAAGFSLLCLVLLGYGSRVPELGRQFLVQMPKRITNEIALFSTAGVLAGALQDSGLGVRAASTLINLSQSNALIIGALVIYGTLVLSLFGLHPVVTVGAFAATINSQRLGIPATFIVGCLASAYAISVITSPFSGLTVMLSTIAMKSPFTVGIVRNIRFALIASFVNLIALATFLLR